MGFRYGHFKEVVGRFGKPDIDIFASRLNYKLPVGLVYGMLWNSLAILTYF